MSTAGGTRERPGLGPGSHTVSTDTHIPPTLTGAERLGSRWDTRPVPRSEGTGMLSPNGGRAHRQPGRDCVEVFLRGEEALGPTAEIRRRDERSLCFLPSNRLTLVFF